MKQFIDAVEVAETLNVSKSKAYGIIKMLNKELAEKGYITISGKVSRLYFQQRIYGMNTESA